MTHDEFLSAGVHIGMKQTTADMKRFIYKIRPDGLSVLNVQVIEDRIKTAAKFLSGFKKILAVSRKATGKRATIKFAEAVNGKAITGRFLPGTITNPAFRKYYEPDVVIVTDPLIDKQSVKEAVKMRIPIIALCDTFNETGYVDYVIPCNNKGKKSVAMIYWALAKEILKERGKISEDKEFKVPANDFECTDDDTAEERREKQAHIKQIRGFRRGPPRR